MIAFGAMLLLAGCRHETELHPEYTVELRLGMDFRYDGHEYEIGSTYTDDFGNLFKLDTLRFFLSGAHAVNDEEEVLAEYPDVFLLMDAAQAGGEHNLGMLTADHLHEVRFQIGLPSSTNHADPATFTEPPLNDATMHSGSSGTGFCFVQLAGRVDSDVDGEITSADQAFQHHLIGDALLRDGAAPWHADLSAASVLTLWLPLEMDVLLAGIDFLNTPSCSGDGPVDTQIMDQLAEAMEQEH